MDKRDLEFKIILLRAFKQTIDKEKHTVMMLNQSARIVNEIRNNFKSNTEGSKMVIELLEKYDVRDFFKYVYGIIKQRREEGYSVNQCASP